MILKPTLKPFHIKTQNIDYLIIGQGLAGSLLSWLLLQEGQNVVVVDEHRPRAASHVAAGIINPITGRRYVKSWMIEILLPVARSTYKSIEQEFGISIFHERNILRCLFNSREENDWLARSGEPSYAPYMLDEAELGGYQSLTELAFSYGELRQSAQVDLPLLVSVLRNYLREKGVLMEAAFDYDALEIKSDAVSYKDINAKKVIFCEGRLGAENPYFSYLPFNLAKGEVLFIRIPEAHFEKLLKHRVFIVPVKDDLYWVGASYDWDFEDEEPTPEGGAFLRERLEDILKVPFEVVTHTAAIRPTVKDRRPFLGLHPEFPALAIFNGLGTKGASLGPYWAKRFCQFLLKEERLDEAVSINRFADLYVKKGKSSS